MLTMKDIKLNELNDLTIDSKECVNELKEHIAYLEFVSKYIQNTLDLTLRKYNELLECKQKFDSYVTKNYRLDKEFESLKDELNYIYEWKLLPILTDFIVSFPDQYNSDDKNLEAFNKLIDILPDEYKSYVKKVIKYIETFRSCSNAEVNINVINTTTNNPFPESELPFVL